MSTASARPAPDRDPAPTRLDRSRVLETAARIVGAEGMAALTMRRIGTELGVDPTAVYRHFRNKQEMLTCLAEWLFSGEMPHDAATPWQDQLRALVDYGFERYRAHVDLGILLSQQDDDTEPLVRFREAILAVLVNGAGMELREAARMSHLIENHIVGCGLFFAIADYPSPGDAYTGKMRRAFALLPADEYPLSSAAAPHLFPDPKEMFDRMTGLLIDAVESAGGSTPQGDAA